jgi:nickel/cobalt transporter (NiCoT) family protein
MSLVLGVGLSRGADSDHLCELTDALLRQHGLDPGDVTGVVTLDSRAQAPAVRRLATAMSADVTGFPSGLLAAQDAPHPSAVVRSVVGTPSVAEAAVLAAGATLVVPKTVLGGCTVAVGVSRRSDMEPLSTLQGGSTTGFPEGVAGGGGPVTGRWTPAERWRLFGVLAVVTALHVAGTSLYLLYAGAGVAAGGLAGSGALAYVLGVRHAFDADHIAAIDDTTRVMMTRGRRPVGVGFFFAMGHSTVVVVLALAIAGAAGRVSASQVDALRSTGATVAVVVAMTFLLVVATLNGSVLRTLVGLWRRLQGGEDTSVEVERALLSRGVLARVAGGRVRNLIKSSWHMYPVGLLMGLGLETASEVTLLAMSATSAVGGAVPLLAVLSLPLLFAAGMSTFDTADSLVMTRLYSWSYRKPARTLFFNIVTTALTVLLAAFIASVYLAGVLVKHAGLSQLSLYAGLSDHFELLGYGIAALFVLTWLGALAYWRAWERSAPA